MRERRRNGGLPAVPQSMPRVEPRVAYPRAQPDEIRITWVGHCTFLIQIGGLNFLTDPIWSRRASPSQLVGPARFSEPGVAFDALPELDGVLISHDHYDHLDSTTVRALADRSGDTLRWLTPLGYRGWFARHRVKATTELDWWESELVGRAASGDDVSPRVEAVALPARHWTRRSPFMTNRRSWCGWALRAPGGPSVFFAGDSGYSALFEEIGGRFGPFDASLLPIGAYEPRWFMKPMHMNPEEAVRVYEDLGAQGSFVAMHWGTFQLTDEEPMEPPVRAREAWAAAGLDPSLLAIPAHGETVVL